MSYRKINYKLRPGKAIERKMIAEALRKLSAISSIKDYQYVGFGSIYFVDFSLFHKSLAISKMISIERDDRARKRVEFNRPFSCIEVFFDSSTNILPQLDLEKPSIIWLDYDGKIDSDVLNDINTVCAKSSSKNVLLLTLNVQPEILPSSDDNLDSNVQNEHQGANTVRSLAEYRLELLRKQVTRKKVPFSVEGKDLSRSGLPKVIRSIVMNEIDSALRVRNALLPDDEKLSFQQLFNIRYDDGASMLTVGGVIVNDKDKYLVSSVNFEELKFCSFGEEAYQIKIPNLTNKEVSHLDSELHNLYDFYNDKLKKVSKSQDLFLDSDIMNYASIYRFYPTYAESIW